MTLVEARTTDDWRAWLAEHGESATEAWLVIHHKNSTGSALSPRYHEAIEHALCFGWIDGLHRKRDERSSQLRFTPRSPRSTWSQVNRDRAANMIALGLMTDTGQAMINLAKEKGTWHAADSVPPDLRELLNGNAKAAENFERFPPSSKRLILEWIATAKKPETRQRRVTQTVTLAADNIRANHPKPH